MNLHELRDAYGRVYVTSIGGLDIPWRPLSVDDFLKYQEDISRNIYPLAVLEDEIFNKCVTEPLFIERRDKLPYGTIQAVVQNIIEHSGIVNIEAASARLDEARARVSSSVMYELAGVIHDAFPVYKPEDIFSMDYETFMLRVAQAESLLIKRGVIKEPLTIFSTKDQVEKKERSPLADKNLRDFWNKTYGPNKNIPEGFFEKPIVREDKIPTSKVEKQRILDNIEKGHSPILDEKGNPKIRKDLARDAREMAKRGGVSIEEMEARVEMVKSAQKIYKDVLDKLNKNKSE